MICLPRRQGQWLHDGKILPITLRLRSRRSPFLASAGLRFSMSFLSELVSLGGVFHGLRALPVKRSNKR